jgi:hypothetical protein
MATEKVLLYSDDDNKVKTFAEWTNIGYPFSILRWLTTVRGAENFHIYLWIAKDMGECTM